jgi:hypothetical protein
MFTGGKQYTHNFGLNLARKWGSYAKRTDLGLAKMMIMEWRGTFWGTIFSDKPG